MLIAFRVDAGISMGSGHVMRCATLAHALVAKGHEVCFFCRPQAGDLCAWLIAQGFQVIELAAAIGGTEANYHKDLHATQHGAWLGVTQAEDAAQTLAAVRVQPDLWIVDHYGLDAYWHKQVAVSTSLLVIDDLADRQYAADLLLDQNLGRSAKDYSGLTEAEVLAGLDYVLLRPEFTRARKQSYTRQRLEHIVITMGGVDQPNATGIALNALLSTELATLRKITVILGQANPHKAEIAQLGRLSQEVKIELVQGVDNMAERLCDADLAIGAAGTTSWERCAVGLPTVIVELAANQKLAAEALAVTGAAEPVALTELAEKLPALVKRIASTPDLLTYMSTQAYNLVDGGGTERVVERLLKVVTQRKRTLVSQEGEK